ncbi:MAG: hypothetical protein ACPGSE_00300 [Synechococcus sp.]
MNATNTTTIQQLTNGQGIGALAALTGAQIVYDNNRNTIRLVFPRLVGKAGAKFKNLDITYNAGTDLYDLKAYKFNRKTFEVEVKRELDGCYCDQLNEVCEGLTGLCLRF